MDNQNNNSDSEESAHERETKKQKTEHTGNVYILSSRVPTVDDANDLPLGVEIEQGSVRIESIENHGVFTDMENAVEALSNYLDSTMVNTRIFNINEVKLNATSNGTCIFQIIISEGVLLKFGDYKLIREGVILLESDSDSDEENEEDSEESEESSIE